MSANFSTERYYQPFVTVNPNSISVVPQLVLGPRPHRQLETFRDNFKDNSHNSKVSKTAQKKISRSLDYLIYLSRPKVIPKGYSSAGKSFRINFVTLTLCSAQIHSDTEITKHILQPLLNYLRKKYNMINYIWRAEKQKNGNLHFHIITDVFIPHWLLREKWNQYLQNLGYITRYSESQKLWYKNGFKVRKEYLKTWPATAQYHAYLQGLHGNWNNPNTTDVHSTKRIRNLKKYLCKYLTKNNNAPITEKEIDSSTVTDLLAISGRLWACSESLSRLKGAKTEYSEKIDQELQVLATKKEVTMIQGDHYSVWYINVSYLKRWRCMALYNLFHSYLALNTV